MKLERTRISAAILAGVLSFTGLSGCGTGTSASAAGSSLDAADTPTPAPEDIFDGSVPLDGAANPVLDTLLLPIASETVTYGNQYATIDASHSSDGYIMVKYVTGETARIKVQVVKTGGVTYTYNLDTDGTYNVFPLSQGNGAYKVTVFRNVSDHKYAQVFTQTIQVALANDLLPFLHPNQYVDFSERSAVVAKAEELASAMTGELAKLSAIYSFVVKNFTYDYDLAKTVQSGYLPDVDAVLARQKGICFDYAAVMCSMLRAEGIPTKLEMGYTSTGEYHAWISTHISEAGWINNVISFDGVSWKLMDPTFASVGKESQSVMEYINNPDNYSMKYCY